MQNLNLIKFKLILKYFFILLMNYKFPHIFLLQHIYYL